MRVSGSGSRRLRTLFATNDDALRRVLDTLGKALDHDVNVLILGEHGTGKNFLAETIHACGNRSAAPFINIECASIPPDIFEAELFGHEKGAFTDAHARKPGRIELAQHGTIYFDEIGSVSPALQAKLLRVVQDRTFSRLGGAQSLDLDVRVISSSSLDLRSALEAGHLRQDLYYRLNVLTVHLPPLRDRRGDIEDLSNRFLRDAAERFGAPAKSLDPATLELLQSYSWPGNLRELRNMIERAALLATGPVLAPEDFPTDGFLDAAQLLRAGAGERWTIEELERRYIREILRQTRNNYSRAAAILGINRKTLFEKRKRYGLDGEGGQ